MVELEVPLVKHNTQVHEATSFCLKEWPWKGPGVDYVNEKLAPNKTSCNNFQSGYCLIELVTAVVAASMDDMLKNYQLTRCRTISH